MTDALKLLAGVKAALNELEVRRKANLTIVIACLNDIDRVTALLENIRRNSDGDVHDES